MEVFLYNSTVCRLCGEENDNGTLLYSSDDNNENLSEIINTYLPIKVSDDGELPRTICPGCHIQLEAAVEFLNLIINGQKILRELHQREKEYKKSVLNSPSTEEIITEKIVYEVNTSNGVYQVEHPIALQVAGLDKPKRKRGRPPKKPKTPEELAQEAAAREQEFIEMKKNEEKDVELSGKRRRKTPPRLKEAVQGKELERILKEEGVIDGEELGRVKKEVDKVPKEPEVIGHLEESGELIVLGKGKGRGRPKGRMRPNREQCAICGAQFSCVGRYMSHVAQHVAQQGAQAGAQHGPERLACTLHQRDARHSGQRGLHDTPTKTEPEEEVTVVMEEDHIQSETENEVSVVEEAPVMNSLPDLNPEPIVAKEEPEQASNLSTEQATKTEVLEVVESEVVEEINVETNGISQETIVETPPEENNVQEVETTATGKPKLKCNHCDKMYSSKQSKSLHIKAAHEGARPFACLECGARFSYPRSLANHAAAHARRRPGARGYACDLCGKVLSHPSSVAYHKEAAHAGQRFVCSKCGKHFKHKQLLQRHQLVHTHHRPYACKLCSATFKSKANLLHHHLLHTGVKKFTCEICKHKFAHKTSLTLHMRWHAGCKPYECKTCGKCFSQKGNLSEHARIHSGEKPFACARCPRRFTTSSQHRLHLRNHCAAGTTNGTTNGTTRGTTRGTTGDTTRGTVCEIPVHPRVMQKQISLLTSANQPQLIEQSTYELEEAEDKVVEEEVGEELQERVIYVAYDVDEHDAPDIHILNSEQADRLEMSKSMSSCSLFGGESLLAPLAPVHTLAPLHPHADHMPVTDEQGNPLHFTMQDGTRLAITSADGKSLQVITQDGQTIPVEINGFAEEEEVDNPDTIVHQLNLQKSVETNVGSPVTHYFTLV